MHFGAFFYGTVDMPDAGADGPPAHRRRYGQEDYRRVYADLLAYAQHCDALGYDSMWTAEHHFHQHGFEVVPNVVLLNAVLAQHTRRICLGALIHVLTTWHPLHFAEDYALADVLAGGRLLCGLGRGTEGRESHVFGVNVGYHNNPDDLHNRAVFEEQVAIFQAATAHERFAYCGTSYNDPPRGPDLLWGARRRVAAGAAVDPHPRTHLSADQQRRDAVLRRPPASRGGLRQPSLRAADRLVAPLRLSGGGGPRCHAPTGRGPPPPGAAPPRRLGGGGAPYGAARTRRTHQAALAQHDPPHPGAGQPPAFHTRGAHGEQGLDRGHVRAGARHPAGDAGGTRVRSARDLPPPPRHAAVRDPRPARALLGGSPASARGTRTDEPDGGRRVTRGRTGNVWGEDTALQPWHWSRIFA